MENCKLVNSKEVEKKILRLDLGLNIQYSENQSFVIIEDNKYCSIQNMDMYNRYEIPEITQADFLALPEPFKVGDWVKEGNKIIFLVESIEGDRLFSDISGISFYDGNCTKLTQEQINILELEAK